MNRIPAVVPLVVSLLFLASSPNSPAADGKTEQRKQTFSSLDAPNTARDSEKVNAGTIHFEELDLPQVLKIYEDLSARSLIRSPQLPAAKISLEIKTTLSRRGALQALDTALAQHGVTMIPMGTDFVKAVPASQAGTEAAPIIELPLAQLPHSDSYMTYIVHLKYALPREISPALQPFARMPGSSIMAVDSARIVVLRDYSNNIRRMLEMLELLDTPAQLEAGRDPFKHR